MYVDFCVMVNINLGTIDFLLYECLIVTDRKLNLVNIGNKLNFASPLT